MRGKQHVSSDFVFKPKTEIGAKRKASRVLYGPKGGCQVLVPKGYEMLNKSSWWTRKWFTDTWPERVHRRESDPYNERCILAELQEVYE